jgi:hypothetical protein
MCQEDVHFSGFCHGKSNEELFLSAKKWEILLCAAVGTARHQRGLRTYSVEFNSGILLMNDKAAPSQCAVN